MTLTYRVTDPRLAAPDATPGGSEARPTSVRLGDRRAFKADGSLQAASGLLVKAAVAVGYGDLVRRTGTTGDGLALAAAADVGPVLVALHDLDAGHYGYAADQGLVLVKAAAATAGAKVHVSATDGTVTDVAAAGAEVYGARFASGLGPVIDGVAHAGYAVVEINAPFLM